MTLSSQMRHNPRNTRGGLALVILVDKGAEMPAIPYA
jgi:hypothetical protein